MSKREFIKNGKIENIDFSDISFLKEFTDIVFNKVIFDKATFNGSVFRRCEFTECSFIDSEIKGVDILFCYFGDCVFTNAKWSSETNITKSEFNRCIDFTPYLLRDNNILNVCPFCGSIPKIEEDRTIYVIRCKTCSTSMLGERISEEEIEQEPQPDFTHYKTDLINKWNKNTASSK